MLSDFYPPNYGGMEKNVQTLCRGLISKGHNVVVCTTHQEGFLPFIEEKGVKIFRLEGLFQKMPFLFKDSTRKYHPPVKDWIITKKIRRIIQEMKPDVIDSHGWILHSILPLKKEYNIPFFISLHDFGIICPTRYSYKYQGVCDNPLTNNCIFCGRERYGLVKSFLTYFTLKYSNKLMKKFSAFYLYSTPNIAEYFGLSHTRFLPHPIDTEFYRPIETPEYDERILCWAALSKGKGMDIIFEVAKQLPMYQFDITFIGADKEYYSRIKRDNIHFFPRQNQKEIPNLINKYPIVLGQFQAGAMGGSELEAMACGKPLIGYWNRKYDSYYKSPCPILSTNNVEEIISLIKTYAGNKNVGEISREWVIKNHSMWRVVDKLINIYNCVQD